MRAARPSTTSSPRRGCVRLGPGAVPRRDCAGSSGPRRPARPGRTGRASGSTAGRPGPPRAGAPTSRATPGRRRSSRRACRRHDRGRSPDRDLLPERPDARGEGGIGRLVPRGRELDQVRDPVAGGHQRVVGGLDRGPARDDPAVIRRSRTSGQPALVVVPASTLTGEGLRPTKSSRSRRGGRSASVSTATPSISTVVRCGPGPGRWVRSVRSSGIIGGRSCVRASGAPAQAGRSLLGGGRWLVVVRAWISAWALVASIFASLRRGRGPRRASGASSVHARSRRG